MVTIFPYMCIIMAMVTDIPGFCKLKLSALALGWLVGQYIIFTLLLNTRQFNCFQTFAAVQRMPSKQTYLELSVLYKHGNTASSSS